MPHQRVIRRCNELSVDVWQLNEDAVVMQSQTAVPWSKGSFTPDLVHCIMAIHSAAVQWSAVRMATHLV